MRSFKVASFFLVIFFQNQLCQCDFDDFQGNVDNFMDAFDDAFTTEAQPTSTDEASLGNEIVTQVSALEEGAVNKNEEEVQPVVEEPAVTETVFPLGGEIKHELNEEVRALAEKVVSSISPQLRLVNVTEAITMVTDKVQRSLALTVASSECEGEACPYACRVELLSRYNEEEVVWQNCIELPSINMVRRKRGAIGGFKQVDDDEARELAEIAAQTLDSIDADDTKRVVLQVLRAQKQLVNGIMYHLTLEMAMSDCKEEAEKCDGKLSDHNICKILMQRLFSGEAPRNAQVIKSECTPISKAKEADNKKSQKRAKRTAPGPGEETNTISDSDHSAHHHPHSRKKNRSHSRMVGGKTKQDPESETIKEISKFALTEIDKASNSLNKQKVVRVVDARSQVVAGVKYFLRMELVETDCRKDSSQTDCNPLDDQVLQSCDVVVWDKPWEKFRTITKLHCSPIQSRSKRGVPGGLHPADPNDPGVQEAAKFAVSEVDKRSNSLFSSKLVVVKEAQTQVVAGKNYYLKLQLVETNCRKDSPVNSACSPAPDKVVQECDVVVYDRPWDKHRELTTVNCSPFVDNSVRQKRGLLGGLTPADPNDSGVKEAAEFAVSEVDKKSNSLFSSKLLVVKEAKTQVVAGTNYYLKLQLVETNCRKGAASNSACSPAPDKVVKECDVVVYDRPWDKHRELTSVKCSPFADNRVRNRRDVLVGGLSPADPNDSGVKEAAKFAVSEVDKKSNSLFSSKLLVVKEAKTQVVAGINYHLKLQLVETNCRKDSPVNSACSPASGKVAQECDVVVYDRPWDKHRELTSVKCSPSPDSASRRQQRAVLVGGHTAQDKDSAQVQEMAQFAVEDLNTKSNSQYKQGLVEVLSAHTQVVSGVNYHLKLRVAETECKKSSDAQPAACTPKENGAYQECDVTVWSQPWLNKRQVTKSDCQAAPAPQAKKRTGDPMSVDVSSPEVQEAAKFSLKFIDRGSNSMYKHALLRVVDAQVQTVSGKKYFLTLEIGESECTKHQKEENCNLREANAMNERCNVVVWDRPWLNKKAVLDVKCGIRTKRSIANEPNNMNTVHLNKFEEFKTKYNKVYADKAEHNKRFRIFRANLKKIQAFQENEQGTAVYGPNMFADLTAKEFKQKYLGLKPGRGPKPSPHHMVAADIPDVALPTDFDWREHNAVTPVKDQGQCGSCWAFSVTGNIEGQWAIHHGKLLSFSEQELVDCDKMDNGCNGGYPTQAYEAIENIGGLETEDEYPYDAQDETCKFNQSEVAATVVSSVNITTNETQIAQWLFTNGPISIGINANAMQFYMGGVSHPFKFLCNKEQLDHGVLLVGFGVHRSSIIHKMLPYWLVKNSWGPRWGEKGYYRVYRGDETCGVNQMASSAVVG